MYRTSSCTPPKFSLFEGCKSWITDCSRGRTCYRLWIGNLICQSRARYILSTTTVGHTDCMLSYRAGKCAVQILHIVHCSIATEGTLILLQICHCLQSPSMYEKAEIICGPRPSRHSSKLQYLSRIFIVIWMHLYSTSTTLPTVHSF